MDNLFDVKKLDYIKMTPDFDIPSFFVCVSETLDFSIGDFSVLFLSQTGRPKSHHYSLSSVKVRSSQQSSQKIRGWFLYSRYSYLLYSICYGNKDVSSSVTMSSLESYQILFLSYCQYSYSGGKFKRT
jgi:hypothetical protein